MKKKSSHAPGPRKVKRVSALESPRTALKGYKPSSKELCAVYRVCHVHISHLGGCHVRISHCVCVCVSVRVSLCVCVCVCCVCDSTGGPRGAQRSVRGVLPQRYQYGPTLAKAHTIRRRWFSHGLFSLLSVCICVCMCVCIYVCMCVSVCVCVCMYVYMYVYVCTIVSLL